MIKKTQIILERMQNKTNKKHTRNYNSSVSLRQTSLLVCTRLPGQDESALNRNLMLPLSFSPIFLFLCLLLCLLLAPLLAPFSWSTTRASRTVIRCHPGHTSVPRVRFLEHPGWILETVPIPDRQLRSWAWCQAANQRPAVTTVTPRPSSGHRETATRYEYYV